MQDVEDLVKRAKGKDREAFGELYQQCHKRIYTYVFFHLNGHPPEVAEDLTEEIFLKAMTNIDSFQFKGAPFSAWLYRIAHNHLVDHTRRLLNQPHVSLEAASELRSEDLGETTSTRMTLQELKKNLKTLTELQRQVIVLRFVDGLSLAETAAAVDRSVPAVKELQSRALRSLRKILDKEYN